MVSATIEVVAFGKDEKGNRRVASERVPTVIRVEYDDRQDVGVDEGDITRGEARDILECDFRSGSRAKIPKAASIITADIA